MVVERIKIAISQLMRIYPFISYLMTYCDLRISDEVPTMGVNKEGVLFVNEEWVKTISNDELKGVIIHEILHLVYGHIDRRFNEGRDSKILNVACDLKVNATIKMMGAEQHIYSLELPKGALMTDWNDKFKYDNWEIEKVKKKDSIDLYRELKKLKDNNNDMPDRGNNGDSHMDDNTEKNPNIKGNGNRDSDVDDFWRTKTLQAGQHQKMRGTNCGALDDLIASVGESKQDWRQVIQNMIAGQEISDYTWAKPRKTYASTDIYLPSEVRESVKVGIYVDTSGSVSNDELNRFLNEINGIFAQFNSVEVMLKCFDTKMREKQEFDGHIPTLNIQGRGGTDFNCIFEDDDVNEYSTILVFTDGEAPAPDKREFTGECVWCISKEGDTSYLKDTGDVILEVE